MATLRYFELIIYIKALVEFDIHATKKTPVPVDDDEHEDEDEDEEFDKELLFQYAPSDVCCVCCECCECFLNLFIFIRCCR